MVPEAPSLPAAEPGPSVRDRAAALWRGLDRRAQLALAGGTALLVLVVILLATGVFSGDDFTPDQNSPDYRNGYGYGHNLMTVTTNPTNECAEAVAGLGGTDDRNWNAGCRAGYADAHH
jgi:hypothetical protein